MKLYAIPPLYCPFPSEVHPDIHAIEAHTDHWVQDFSLLSSYQQLEKYRQQKFGAMIARSYPYGDYIDLCAWCDLNTLLFIVDDQLDEQEIVKDSAAFFKLENDFLEVLEDGRRCTISKDGPVLAALDDFWQKMLFRSSDTWKYKFIQGIKDMFDGGLWQFKHVVSKRLPNLTEYIVIRQYLGAANLATDSLEVTGQIKLEEKVYNSPFVHRLTEISRNAICFANDLFSLSKEIAQSKGGAEFNIVTILQHKYKTTIENAIYKAKEIHDELVHEFEILSAAACSFDEDTNTRLRKYVRALQHLMKGNIDWSTRDTSRYPHIIGS